MQQPPAQEASSAKAAQEVSKAVSAMLEPDPSVTWALPRAFPVDVCPTNYSRTIQVDSDSGVILDATPDLEATLKLHQKPKNPAAQTIRASLDATTLFIARNNLRIYPKFNWTGAGGPVTGPPSFEIEDTGSFILEPVAFQNGVAYEFKIIPNRRLIYAGSAPAWGNTSVAVTFAGGNVTTLNQTINTLDANLVIAAQDTQATANPVSTTSYANVVGIAGASPFFEFYFDLVVPAASSITVTAFRAEILNTNITFSQVQTTVYGPSPDISGSLYNSVKNSSSKYSFPLLSMLVTYVGSDLLNGGNIAIGVIPDDYPLSLIPQVAYDQICALGGHRYSGPMKDGVHGIYIPDDVTRIAFFPTDEKIRGRRLAVAILPQVVAAGQSSAVTMRIELRSHIEWINPSQTLAHMTASCCCSELVESMFAALEHADQVGENPSHVKRIKEAVKRVAQDPRTKQVAAKALSWLGKGALMAIPALLA